MCVLTLTSTIIELTLVHAVPKSDSIGHMQLALAQKHFHGITISISDKIYRIVRAMVVILSSPLVGLFSSGRIQRRPVGWWVRMCGRAENGAGRRQPHGREECFIVRSSAATRWLLFVRR